MAELTFHDVRKHFGSLAAVRGVSLDVRKGELVCLLGPSGCGKTTILNMLAGFLHPDGGEITLNGRPISALPPRRRNMGMVFQSYALFPHMTVVDNVGFGLEARGVGQADRRGRAAKMLDVVGLGGLGRRFPRELSGGQQQRVALARALVIEPDVLLLDEPFSNLDAKLRQQLRGEVREIQQRLGITTLFVTHDQEEAMAISDRVAVLNDGRIEQVDTPHRLYRRPRTAFVANFLGEANVLDGTLVAAEPGGRMTLSVGGTLLAAEGSSLSSAPDRRISICVRPERIRLTPLRESSATRPENGLDGQLAGQVFLGARNRYVVATDCGPMIVTADETGPLGIGEAVRLSWDPIDAWILDAGDPAAHG